MKRYFLFPLFLPVLISGGLSAVFGQAGTNDGLSGQLTNEKKEIPVGDKDRFNDAYSKDTYINFYFGLLEGMDTGGWVLSMDLSLGLDWFPNANKNLWAGAGFCSVLESLGTSNPPNTNGVIYQKFIPGVCVSGGWYFLGDRSTYAKGRLDLEADLLFSGGRAVPGITAALGGELINALVVPAYLKAGVSLSALYGSWVPLFSFNIGVKI